jgi:hypothetical protein
LKRAQFRAGISPIPVALPSISHRGEIDLAPAQFMCSSTPGSGAVGLLRQRAAGLVVEAPAFLPLVRLLLKSGATRPFAGTGRLLFVREQKIAARPIDRALKNTRRAGAWINR